MWMCITRYAKMLNVLSHDHELLTCTSYTSHMHTHITASMYQLA